MTQKLYQTDSYRREFTGTVLSCEPLKKGYAVTLDRTAFYPEGGGQPSDHGTLGQAHVVDVQEKADSVIHTTDSPLTIGTMVKGTVNWPRRFSHMQQHTGEHIVSGIVHQLFGAENVGFHMGTDLVTVDFDVALTTEQVEQIELLANQVIWENRPIEILFPNGSELEKLQYRSKKELTGQVRIITIPGCDTCACCGTHTEFTGEVGIIKLLSCQNYKGGVRISMLCGNRALADYQIKNQNTAEISAMLSAKPDKITAAVSRILQELTEQKQQYTQLQARMFAEKIDSLNPDGKQICLFYEELAPNEVRQLCSLLCEKAALGAVFSKNEKGFSCAVGAMQSDIRPLFAQMKAELSGRGGGTAQLSQGSVAAQKQQIEAFFANQGWEISE